MSTDRMAHERPLPGGSQLAESRREVQRLESELAAERARNIALVQSRSWRLTAPLRWFMEKVRGRTSSPGQMTTAPAAPGDGHIGVAALPVALQKPQLSTLEAANDTCRRINLFPGLAGVVPDPVREVLSGDAVAGQRRGEPCEEGALPAIGFIGSPELCLELDFDARVVALDESNWSAKLVSGALQFLLVETVWHAGARGWRYALVSDGDTTAFRRVLERCRDVSLPVVVWFRETPDNLDSFAWLAGQADLVLAADPQVATRLKQAFPQASVEFIAPAIQPALHNPLRNYGLMDAADALDDKIVFDGWWDICRGIPELAELRSLAGRGLLVAESRWEFSQARLDDCPGFMPYAIGCQDPEERLVLSRLQGAEVFSSAPLAGGWRVSAGMVQAAACGSPVAYLDGSEPPLPELRIAGQAGAGSLASLVALMEDRLARARWAHEAWRGLMSAHTVAHRLQFIADRLSLGCRFLAAPERIACLLVTMRPDLVGGCIERFRRDAYPDKELVVVLHGDGADVGRCRAMVREGEPISVFSAGMSRSLGACLNFAVSQTDAPYWTKMDDDDIYGVNYLSDIMLYQRVGGFQVFGKPPMFNYLEAGDDLLWDPEWARHANLVHEAGKASAALVAGGTLGGRREVLDAVPFSEVRRGGSDSEFIRRCYQAGLDVMAMDGFNFVRFRSSQEGFHTWSIGDDEIRSRSMRIGGMGDLPRMAMC